MLWNLYQYGGPFAINALYIYISREEFAIPFYNVEPETRALDIPYIGSPEKAGKQVFLVFCGYANAMVLYRNFNMIVYIFSADIDG